MLFRLLLLWVIGLFLTPSVRAACTHARKGDPLQVYLVTTTPGGMVFNSMGHTALWFTGGHLDTDRVFNWGAYNGKRPDLLTAFLSGRMEFWLADETYEVQWRRTVRQERGLVAQRLNLPRGAAEKLLYELVVGARPENRNYVYHWAVDNCATRARDVIDGATGGQLRGALQTPVAYQARHEGARHLSRWWPVELGFQFLASDYLDQPISAWEAGMVPERLMHALDGVKYTDGDGLERALVAETCTLREGRYGWAPTAPRTWWAPAGGLLVIALGALGLGRRAHRSRWAAGGLGIILALYAVIPGVLGAFTFGLWLASDLDGVGPTESWFLANPLTLVILAGLAWCCLRGRPPGRVLLWAARALAGLAVLGAVVKVSPWFRQENLQILALLGPTLLGGLGGIELWARAGARGGSSGIDGDGQRELH